MHLIRNFADHNRDSPQGLTAPRASTRTPAIAQIHGTRQFAHKELSAYRKVFEGSNGHLSAIYVPGYGGPAMVRTPWGNAADLRSMKMRPGRGNAPEESERSQRERLFGAMVAISSEQGYEATKIGDLAKLAGVSRAAFYEHFANKKELPAGRGRGAGRADDRRDRARRGRADRRGAGPPGGRSLPQPDRLAAGGLEDGLHRGLRGRPRGRSDGRAGARHLRTLRGRTAEPDSRAARARRRRWCGR